MTRDAAREAEAMRDLLREWDGWELGCGRPVPAKLSHAKAADTIDALLAENAALRRALEWRPISEAPKDGTPVLLGWQSHATGKWVVASTHWKRGRWAGSPTTFAPGWPTHWLPLDALPTPPAGGAHG